MTDQDHRTAPWWLNANAPADNFNFNYRTAPWWILTPDARQMRLRFRTDQSLRFAERQRRSRQWISLAEIGLWIASERWAIDGSDWERRGESYRDVLTSIRAGEFEQAGRSLILCLFNRDSPLPLRLEREGVPLWLLGTPDLDHAFLRCCWVPRRLARRWFDRRSIPWPSIFEPTKQPHAGLASHADAGVTIGSGGRSESTGDASAQQPQPAESRLEPVDDTSPLKVSPEPELPPDKIVEILTEWIFARHQRQPRRFADLKTEARKDTSLGTFTQMQLLEACHRVYKTEAHRPPMTGWPLREPYAERWRKEQEK